MTKFRLFCDNSPRALGIEDESGAWDMVEFEKHIEKCEICSCATRKIRRQMEDALRKDKSFFLNVLDIFRRR